MEINESVIKSNSKSKNIYIAVGDDRYYVFEPKLEYFGLTDKSKELYDNSINRFEQAQQEENQKVDENNKKYYKQLEIVNKKMKNSNIINACITILLVIIMLINMSSSIAVVLFSLAIIVPILIYFCSKKYFESEITYKYMERPKVDKDKFVDRDLERELHNYEHSIKLYKGYPHFNSFDRTLSEVEYYPDLNRDIMIERAKMYCQFLGYTQFENTEDRNIFIAKNEDKKFLVWINQIFNRQIYFKEELAILKGKLTRYPNCERALMYINTQTTNPIANGDNSNCEVVGEKEISEYLSISRNFAIISKRREFYGINKDATIEGHRCNAPKSYFYRNGNLKYYGEIERISTDNNARGSTIASSGYGIYLDENGEIVKYGHLKKGEIINLEDDSTCVCKTSKGKDKKEKIVLSNNLENEAEEDDNRELKDECSVEIVENSVVYYTNKKPLYKGTIINNIALIDYGKAYYSNGNLMFEGFCQNKNSYINRIQETPSEYYSKMDFGKFYNEYTEQLEYFGIPMQIYRPLFPLLYRFPECCSCGILYDNTGIPCGLYYKGKQINNYEDIYLLIKYVSNFLKKMENNFEFIKDIGKVIAKYDESNTIEVDSCFDCVDVIDYKIDKRKIIQETSSATDEERKYYLVGYDSSNSFLGKKVGDLVDSRYLIIKIFHN